MNTQRHLTPVLMIAATLAAAFTVQSAEAVEPAKPVVTLPRVEVIASRASFVEAAVVQLPRVTVIGKRPTTEPTRLAQRPAAAARRS